MNTSQLAALLQLSSPALPIGGFSYSQGFEAAVDQQLVSDESSASRWIEDQLTVVMAQCDAPVWMLLFDAWSTRDFVQASYWNDWFHASRETNEMRRETEQMGWSLAKLASDLNWGEKAALSHLLQHDPITLLAAHAFSAHALTLNRQDGLTACLFSWLENQVMAAIKTIPLGQAAGQRILNQLRQLIPDVIQQAEIRAADSPPHICSMGPQLAILSSRHETQYSRLFRS
ncbi:urease accessory protein UreF [Paralcaligenes sp. KSB-10]|uniref:urease accessory protein UreF n=1 Tax=Paralcaligenes sp. KSB-10 TaxID=2901142 RepID=UPI001E5E818B|nr:urease accessory protein UreF [Paralcaligenes sp. KSB-10]UHL63554.1 urease accessory protein UreF [Paralcaligenes sp. KSB-10]